MCAIEPDHRATAGSAGQLRALRDELGWTQADLAEAVGVTPAEVSAWEAGVVPVDARRQMAIDRERRLELRKRAMAAAGLEPCAWAAAMADLAEREDRIMVSAAIQGRIRRHQKRCPVCRQIAEVERTIPPSRQPQTQTESGWMARMRNAPLPRPLGLAVALTARVLPLAALLFGMKVLSSLGDPAQGFRPPVAEFLAMVTGWAALGVGGHLLDDLYDDHPFWAGVLHTGAAAALAAVALAWIKGWNLATPVLWVGAAVVAVIGGFVLALAEDNARDEERKALERAQMQPPPTGAGAEEQLTALGSGAMQVPATAAGAERVREGVEAQRRGR